MDSEKTINSSPISDTFVKVLSGNMGDNIKHVSLVSNIVGSLVKYEQVVFNRDDRRFKLDTIAEFFGERYECIEKGETDYVNSIEDNKYEKYHRSLYLDKENDVYYSVSLEPAGSKGSYALRFAFISLLTENIEKVRKVIMDYLVDNSVKVKAASKGYLSMIVQTQSGFATSKFALNPIEVDLNTHYGAEFMPKHERIMEGLKNGKKGIVLLHGLPGTGKTSYLRYLVNELKDMKEQEIIFLPPHMCDSLASPSFMPFLAAHPNSILVVEDAERAILSRDAGQGSSQAVSNLLNISDGLLSDFLNIKIIATYNTDRGKVDPALMRKGRLIAEHDFGKLSITDAQALMDKLEIEHTVTEDMTLAEIYNVQEDNFASKKPKRAPIGFGASKA